ncbi:MAG TPA: hypothetical protein VGD37_18730 [Kofleriaceae bacterium]
MLGGCTVHRDQPNLVGQDIRLTVIHTSDIHSRLFPYNFVPNTFDQGYGLLTSNAPFGGIARISTLVKQIRRSANRSLWLDSGDCFQGAPVFRRPSTSSPGARPSAAAAPRPRSPASRSTWSGSRPGQPDAAARQDHRYGAISCLDEHIEAHDGRIRAVFE